MMAKVRPIDANAMLADETEAYNNVQAKLDPNSMNYKVNWAVHQKLHMLLADTPTLDDYEPVRHGKWKLCSEKPITVKVDEWVVCSECNRDFMRFTGIWFNFCPYCGAKMDRGQHD